MRKTLILMLVFLSLNSSASTYSAHKISNCTLPDTTVLSQILNLPLNSYIGKPLDSLFLVLPNNYTDRQFMPYGIGYCKGLFQSYGTMEMNTVSVEIYIINFQYLSFPNRTKTSTWDMSLAKKETIAFIKVIKNNRVCFFGCNNPNFYN